MSSCSSAQKEKTFEFRAIRSTFPSKTISQRARWPSRSRAPPPSLMLRLSIEQAPHEPGTPQGGPANGTSRVTHSVPTGIATAPLADQGRGPLSPQSHPSGPAPSRAAHGLQLHPRSAEPGGRRRPRPVPAAARGSLSQAAPARRPRPDARRRGSSSPSPSGPESSSPSSSSSSPHSLTAPPGAAFTACGPRQGGPP